MKHDALTPSLVGKEKMTPVPGAATSHPVIHSPAAAAASRLPEHGEQSVLEYLRLALGSASSPQENSFWPLQKLQDIIPELKSQYKTYETAAVQKVKDELMIVHEHPAAASGVAILSGLLLMRGPRRFLWRHTLARLQSEEAQLVKIDSGLKDLGVSVDKLKKESKNMILRASFGEEELQRGHTKIRNAGKEIQRLVKSIYKSESQAADLMNVLRAIPGRNALKLRAEVASMTSDLRQQRHKLDQKILKLSELGVRV